MFRADRLLTASLMSCLVALPACSYEQAEWTFDKDDMQEAVFGTWHGDYTVTGDDPVSLTLEIKPPDPSLTQQCGTRTFSESAPAPGLSPACSVESSLSLAATLSIEESSFSDTELTGYFLVPGNQLSRGELALEADAGFRLSAVWREGVFEDCEVWDRVKVADCTLTERE